MYKVFVDGQEGTTGLQIRERLARHPSVSVLDIAPEKRKDQDERRRLINEADVVFLCLPDAAAKESVALIDAGNTRTKVIDASTAHRVAPGWVYGLPELSPAQRAAVRGSKRVAMTGCHAAGFVLLAHPLVAAGILPKDYPVSCHSLTGYSGGGKKMIAEYEEAAPSRKLDASRMYGLGMSHKHLPEMQTYSGLSHQPSFVPIVDNVYKGMGVCITLQTRLLKAGTTLASVHAALAKHYEGERFVRVMPLNAEQNTEAGFFNFTTSNDSNCNDIFVFGNDERIALVSRLDNLGKGASGGAVQCMNVMLGVDEATSLV